MRTSHCVGYHIDGPTHVNFFEANIRDQAGLLPSFLRKLMVPVTQSTSIIGQ
jgi:hypothetical protein